MTSRAANLLTAVGLVALTLLLAWTAPRWSRLFRAPVAGSDEDYADAGRAGSEPGAPPGRSAAPAGAERRISVKLYFRATDAPQLEPEERAVTFSADLSRQVQLVAEELLRGSQTGLLAPLPEGSQVLDAFVTGDGTAYLDLSVPGIVPPPGDPMEFELATPTPEPEATGERATPGASPTPPPTPQLQGSKEELLAVYSLVNTVAGNLPAVRRVQILFEGRSARTLAGHVDLTRPLAADMTYLAPPPQTVPAPPEPAAGESGAGSAAGSGTGAAPEAAAPPGLPLPSPSPGAQRAPELRR